MIKLWPYLPARFSSGEHWPPTEGKPAPCRNRILGRHREGEASGGGGIGRRPLPASASGESAWRGRRQPRGKKRTLDRPRNIRHRFRRRGDFETAGTRPANLTPRAPEDPFGRRGALSAQTSSRCGRSLGVAFNAARKRLPQNNWKKVRKLFRKNWRLWLAKENQIRIIKLRNRVRIDAPPRRAHKGEELRKGRVSSTSSPQGDLAASEMGG